MLREVPLEVYNRPRPRFKGTPGSRRQRKKRESASEIGVPPQRQSCKFLFDALKMRLKLSPPSAPTLGLTLFPTRPERPMPRQQGLARRRAEDRGSSFRFRMSRRERRACRVCRRKACLVATSLPVVATQLQAKSFAYSCQLRVLSILVENGLAASRQSSRCGWFW